jgi:hypothetical protein
MKTSDFMLVHPCGFTISRHLTESDIANIDGITKQDMGTGYIWYSVPSADLSGSMVAVSLCFHKGILDRLQVAVETGGEAVSWDDWSEEKERLRAEHTDNWLSRIGYPPGKYDWGEVWAGYDPKGGFGGGSVRYFPKK